MQDDHARGLKEDTLIGVTIVVGVLIFLGIGEHVGSTGPADTCKHCVLQEKPWLGLVIEDLTVAEITKHSLVLLSVFVAIKNRHYVQKNGKRNGTQSRSYTCTGQDLRLPGTGLGKKACTRQAGLTPLDQTLERNRVFVNGRGIGFSSRLSRWL